MSSVKPDTVSPSFFIFSAAISVCFTSSISSQVRSLYSDGRPFWRKSFITSPKIPYFSPAPSPRYNSSKLICAISAPPLQYKHIPQRFVKVQRELNYSIINYFNIINHFFNVIFCPIIKGIKNPFCGGIFPVKIFKVGKINAT